jgi:hypothetical protein
MLTACLHPEHAPRHDDGIEEVNDGFVRLRHPTAGWMRMMDGECVWQAAECDQWVHEGDGVRPCHVCRPGAYAVWKKGLWFNSRGQSWAWERNNRARAVFRQAAGRWPNYRNDRGELIEDRPMRGDEEALEQLERSYPQFPS